jgi:hypothetical protein
MKSEYITCSAIWYKDLLTSSFRPKNVDKGVVVCGHRHHNCIDIMKTIGGLRSVIIGEMTEGFLTSDNRFVDRMEAMEIAVSQNQVTQLHNPKIGLFSEDLY